ncbi:hypothetical protein BDW59DRAFT_82091 [Aspergillus cavernicola]|uniref:Uncharacterized protein n=1 Tax=Aspergillus cavernicola TaxID=176166 RepID=A0ABR4IAI4_9EURO
MIIADQLSHTAWRSEVYIVLTVVTMIVAFMFWHYLFGFVVAFFRLRGSASDYILRMVGVAPAGYAQLDRPIYITMTGDEESFSQNNSAGEKVTLPPPAYGRWRNNVRLNPDLLYWQRIDRRSLAHGRIGRAEDDLYHKDHRPRPPSYTSDNGVDYAVGAQPRALPQNS